jgi:hypothetical protein
MNLETLHPYIQVILPSYWMQENEVTYLMSQIIDCM